MAIWTVSLEVVVEADDENDAISRAISALQAAGLDASNFNATCDDEET